MVPGRRADDDACLCAVFRPGVAGRTPNIEGPSSLRTKSSGSKERAQYEMDSLGLVASWIFTD